jgi:hypothetical protein
MPRAVTLVCAALAGFAIVLGVVLLAAVSRNRDFHVDEVEHLHTAYSLRSGHVLYRDAWQSHPPLIYCFLTPLTDVRDPIGSYHRARLLMLIVPFGTIALAAFCAMRLAGPWAATSAAGLLLFHTTFVERGMEVRPDGPALLLATAALALELSRRDRLLRVSLQALLLGTGLVLTQKAIFPLAAFGLCWIWFAWRERRPRLVVQPALLAAVPFVMTLAVAPAFLRAAYLSAASAATHAQTRGTFGPLFFLLRESQRNVVFVLLALAGFAWIVIRRRDEPALVTAFLGAAAVGSLWLNPFPWPYVHPSFLPLLAIIAAVFLGSALKRFATVAILLSAFFAVPHLMTKATPSTALQFATLREIDRLVPANETVFDLAGLYFRPDAYPVFSMSGDMLLSYAYGAFPRIIPDLRRNAAACVTYDYRTAALLPDVKQFIGTHFTHYGGNLFLPGVDLSNAATTIAFEALATKPFRYDGAGAIAVDGTPFVRGTLTRGMHRIDVVRAASPSRLVIDAPPPKLIGPPSPELFRNYD